MRVLTEGWQRAFEQGERQAYEEPCNAMQHLPCCIALYNTSRLQGMSAVARTFEMPATRSSRTLLLAALCPSPAGRMGRAAQATRGRRS